MKNFWEFTVKIHCYLCSFLQDRKPKGKRWVWVFSADLILNQCRKKQPKAVGVQGWNNPANFRSPQNILPKSMQLIDTHLWYQDSEMQLKHFEPPVLPLQPSSKRDTVPPLSAQLQQKPGIIPCCYALWSAKPFEKIPKPKISCKNVTAHLQGHNKHQPI